MSIIDYQSNSSNGYSKKEIAPENVHITQHNTDQAWNYFEEKLQKNRAVSGIFAVKFAVTCKVKFFLVQHFNES